MTKTKEPFDPNAIGILKREDVLKLISNLTSGEYLKGAHTLVTNDRMHFCCLGVWADQHGCVFEQDGPKNDYSWKPRLPKRPFPEGQSTGSLEGYLRFGLTGEQQDNLIRKNDQNQTWDEVVQYLVNDVLPTAK